MPPQEVEKLHRKYGDLIALLENHHYPDRLLPASLIKKDFFSKKSKSKLNDSESAQWRFAIKILWNIYLALNQGISIPTAYVQYWAKLIKIDYRFLIKSMKIQTIDQKINIPDENLPDEAIKFLEDVAFMLFSLEQMNKLPEYCFFHELAYWTHCQVCNAPSFIYRKSSDEALNEVSIKKNDMKDLFKGNLKSSHITIILDVLLTLYAWHPSSFFDKIPEYNLIVEVDHNFFGNLYKTVKNTLILLYNRDFMKGHRGWVQESFPLREGVISKTFIETLAKQEDNPDPTLENLYRIIKVYDFLLTRVNEENDSDNVLKIFQENFYWYFLKLIKFHPYYWKNSDNLNWSKGKDKTRLSVKQSGYSLEIDGAGHSGNIKEILSLLCNFFEDVPFNELCTNSYGIWVSSNVLHCPYSTFRLKSAQIPILADILTEFKKDHDMDLFLRRKDISID